MIKWFKLIKRCVLRILVIPQFRKNKRQIFSSFCLNMSCEYTCECSKGHKLLLFFIDTCEALGSWTFVKIFIKVKYNITGIRRCSTNA